MILYGFFTITLKFQLIPEVLTSYLFNRNPTFATEALNTSQSALPKTINTLSLLHFYNTYKTHLI